MADKTKSRPMRALQVQPDPLIHARIRLGIVSALLAGETLSFGDLKTLVDTTDGNLSVHARKLEEAGYIECLKSFHNRTPRTEYRLTGRGRKALVAYLKQLEEVLQLARGENL